MKVGDIFVALGFNVDDKELSAFDKNIAALKKNLIGIPIIAAAAAFAIDRFVASSVAGAVALQNFNRQTGLMSSELQKLQMAGQLTDIALTAEGVAGAVQSLQTNLSSIRLGGGDVGAFQLAGIDVIGRNAFQVIDQVREAFQGGRLGDRSTASNLLDRMGLGKEFIALLEISKNEFESLSRGLVRSDKTLSTLGEMGTAITKLKLILANLKDTIAASIGPIVSMLANVFSRIFGMVNTVLEATKDLVHGTVGKLLDGLKEFATEAPNAFRILKGIFLGFAVKITVAFAPLLAIIAAVFLLLEDFIVFSRGGKSALGALTNGFKRMGVIIISVFKRVRQSIIESIMGPLVLINDLIELAGGLLNSPAGIKTGEIISRGLENVKNSPVGQVINTTFNIVTEAGEDAIDGIRKAGEEFIELLPIAYDEMTAGDAR